MAPPEHAFITDDPVVIAKEAGLRYVTGRRPGIRRERRGDDLRYIGVDGDAVTDARTLDRIAQLGIPPAWERVWISPLANGHILATGRDAKGRKQYRYHDRWRALRDETQPARVIAFGEAPPSRRWRKSWATRPRFAARAMCIPALSRRVSTVP
jgi:DNA topoisomerase-1